MQTFEIIPLDKTNIDHVRGVAELSNTVRDHHLEAWPTTTTALELANRFIKSGYSRSHEWLAVVEGDIVGHVSGDLPTEDNTHLAECEVIVHPEHRRRGIGSALLEKLEKEAAAEGRDTFLGWTITSFPEGPRFDESGAAFCEARGYATSNVEVQRRCDLAAVDEKALDGLLAEAWKHAGDYELVEFGNEIPDDVVEGLAVLESNMYTDVPLGDTDIREADITPERMRAVARTRTERNSTMLNAIVRHKPSGEVAGWTQIAVRPGDPQIAYQENTIVHKTHRGHRLGTILKIANQRRLRQVRPTLQYVDTWNAESNGHMIAINEAVGYRKLARELEVQKKIS
ncbi:GNAT family N-acetyltransferase [Salininema proteolyticum]|uniref:GNAT family N-acetyltransferase n=1 Tax=Salininema proteolyticum TaxID=1607685 RepID=A0ABV8TSL1_9ACTN